MEKIISIFRGVYDRETTFSSVSFIMEPLSLSLSLLARLETAARGGSFRLRVYLRRTSLAVGCL